MRRRNITQLESILKRIVDKYIKEYKRRPTPQEIEGYLKRINFEMYQEVDSTVRNVLTKVYERSKRQVSTELGMRLQMQNMDYTAIQVLLNEDVYTKAISGLTQVSVEKLREVFERAYVEPQGFNVKMLQREIQQVSDMADYRAERIARAETYKVSVASRRMSYLQADPNDTFLYVARGPRDNRTSKMSMELQEATKDGVTWNEYVQLSMQIASLYNPKWKVNLLAPLMQPNQRTSPFRKVT